MKYNGFTLVELLVGIAIIGILMLLAMPALSEFTVKLRVDSELSSLQRLTLIARNHAISTGQNVTLCPLADNNNCVNNWQNELSVFTDANSNRIFESNLGEELIQTKTLVNTNDTLIFNGGSSLRYRPDGSLTPNGTFKFCPANFVQLSRGLTVSRGGRLYLSSDLNNDGQDEGSDGNPISCI
jgi:prepilin-type N-terminal cleavage/methylation domain-containing protein